MRIFRLPQCALLRTYVIAPRRTTSRQTAPRLVRSVVRAAPLVRRAVVCTRGAHGGGRGGALAQIGQDGQGTDFSARLAMRVTVHRQRDRRVAGEDLSGLGVDTASRQITDKRVSEGVEIREPFRRILFGDTRGFEVSPENANHFPSRRHLER